MMLIIQTRPIGLAPCPFRSPFLSAHISSSPSFILNKKRSHATHACPASIQHRWRVHMQWAHGMRLWWCVSSSCAAPSTELPLISLSLPTSHTLSLPALPHADCMSVYPCTTNDGMPHDDCLAISNCTASPFDTYAQVSHIHTHYLAPLSLLAFTLLLHSPSSSLGDGCLLTRLHADRVHRI